MGKYSVGDLTTIAMRCKEAHEVEQLEDTIYFLVDEYSKVELNTIFTVINGKKTLF